MDNPYAAPASDLEVDDVVTDSEIRVDGKFLVVRSPSTLPPFCVKTNVAITPKDVKKRTITWCAPVWILTILFGGLLFVIVYLIVRKTCVISYGVSGDVRRKYRNRMLIKVACAVVLFFGIPISAASDSTIAMTVVTILFLVSIVSLFIGNSPLSVTKHKKGEFWMSGCSKEFLARIQEQKSATGLV